MPRRARAMGGLPQRQRADDPRSLLERAAFVQRRHPRHRRRRDGGPEQRAHDQGRAARATAHRRLRRRRGGPRRHAADQGAARRRGRHGREQNERHRRARPRRPARRRRRPMDEYKHALAWPTARARSVGLAEPTQRKLARRRAQVSPDGADRRCPAWRAAFNEQVVARDGRARRAPRDLSVVEPELDLRSDAGRALCVDRLPLPRRDGQPVPERRVRRPRSTASAKATTCSSSRASASPRSRRTRARSPTR